MKHQSIEKNLVDLVCQFSSLSLLQLYTFFRPVCKPDLIYRYVLKHVRNNHMILTDDQYVKWKDTSGFKPHWVEALDEAFWILANFGYDKVEEIWMGSFPTVIVFTTTNREAYDISYINSMAYAERAKQKIQQNRNIRLKSTGKEEDPFYHICLVSNEMLGKNCRGYGFDSYCVLDKKTHIPKYYTWEF